MDLGKKEASTHPRKKRHKIAPVALCASAVRAEIRPHVETHPQRYLQVAALAMAVWDFRVRTYQLGLVNLFKIMLLGICMLT